MPRQRFATMPRTRSAAMLARRVVTVAVLGSPLASLLGGIAGCEPPPTPAPLSPSTASLEERLAAIVAELPPPATDGVTTPVPLEGDPAALDRLRRALDAIVAADERAHAPLTYVLGATPDDGPPAQAHIAMLGASHVASDLVSGFLRERLQRHFGDAGHGFVTAVPPFEDYWQWGAHVADGEGWAVLEATAKFREVAALGLNGMAFETRECAWAEVATDHASHVELMLLAQPGGGAIDVSIDGAAALHIPTAADEVHPVIEHVALTDGPHRIRIDTDGEGPVRTFGVALSREVPGVVVDQLGLNATTAAHLLQNEERSQRELLASRRADLFVLWLGSNEASEDWPIEVQEERFAAAVERLSDAMPSAGCLVIGPLDRRQHDPLGRPFVPWALGPIAAMQRDVAIEHGCAYYDAMRWQLGPGAVERFELAHPPLVRLDRIHLTHEGYVRFASDLLRALATALLEHR